MTITQANMIAGRALMEATITCNYFDGERKCTENGVKGTEGGWCPKHGLEAEQWMLDKDSSETRPEYKMDDEERFFVVMEIAKYDLALVSEELAVAA